MHCAEPDILIGVSGQPGLFTEQVIRAMHANCEAPIIFPLSNPSKQVEAYPKDVIKWTDGKAIVATGSPFEPVVYNGVTYPIPQCNNSYIFPGIGLGVIAAKATRITDAMLIMSSEMLAESSPLANTGKGSLLPALTEIETLSKRIAFAVAKKQLKRALRLRFQMMLCGQPSTETTGYQSIVTTSVAAFNASLLKNRLLPVFLCLFICN